MGGGGGMKSRCSFPECRTWCAPSPPFTWARSRCCGAARSERCTQGTWQALRRALIHDQPQRRPAEPRRGPAEQLRVRGSPSAHGQALPRLHPGCALKVLRRAAHAGHTSTTLASRAACAARRTRRKEWWTWSTSCARPTAAPSTPTSTLRARGRRAAQRAPRRPRLTYYRPPLCLRLPVPFPPTVVQ